MEKPDPKSSESSKSPSIHIEGNVQGNVIIGDGNRVKSDSEKNTARKTIPRKAIPRKKKRSRRADTAIVVAIIGAIATVIAAFFNSSLLSKWVESTPTLTAVIPTSAPTLTETPAPTKTPLSTETSAPTQTPEPTLTPAATETLAPTITLMPTLGVGSSIESRGVTMMYVPAGNFVMGNGSGREEVKPAHTVYLGAFYMDQYEVTNAAYKRCVDSNGCGAPQSKGSFNIPSYYENSIYADYPVLFVSWPQAKQYCEWRGMRLPTEAEWEKAARGETGNRTYPWKGAFDGTKLNFCDKNCPVSKEADKNVDDGYANIAPVGSYEEGKSPYGIYDLAGNVWEWIADWYDAKYYFTSPVENPLGPNAGQDRVLRGGAWNTNKNETQSFYRIGKNPLTAYYDIGFRCAADANP